VGRAIIHFLHRLVDAFAYSRPERECKGSGIVPAGSRKNKTGGRKAGEEDVPLANRFPFYGQGKGEKPVQEAKVHPRVTGTHLERGGKKL